MDQMNYWKIAVNLGAIGLYALALVALAMLIVWLCGGAGY